MRKAGRMPCASSPQSTAPICSSVASPPIHLIFESCPGRAILSGRVSMPAKAPVKVLRHCSGYENMTRKSSRV
eukprot:3136894-Heterocapsa_arctica.AAC.1